MGKHIWRGLVAVSAFAFVTACGCFGGDAPVGKARPGADRQIAPTGTLASATPGRQAEQVTPVDATRGQIGSVVTTKGGRRAQKEAADKATPPRRSAPVDAPAAPEPGPATPKP